MWAGGAHGFCLQGPRDLLFFTPTVERRPGSRELRVVFILVVCDAFYVFQSFAMFAFPDFSPAFESWPSHVCQICCGRVAHMVSACRDCVTFSSSLQPCTSVGQSGATCGFEMFCYVFYAFQFFAINGDWLNLGGNYFWSSGSVDKAFPKHFSVISNVSSDS